MFLNHDGDEGIQPSIVMYWALAAHNVLCGIAKEFSEEAWMCSQNMFPCWYVCQCYNWSSVLASS